MTTIRRLLPYLRPCRRRFLQACLVMAAVAALQGTMVRLIGLVVDNALILKDPHFLRLAVVLTPALFLLKLVLVYTQSYLMSHVGQKGAQVLRAEVFRHLHRLSLEFFWRSRSGEVLAKVTSDLNNIQSGLQFVPLYAIRDTLQVLVLAGVLFHLHWKFALIALAGGPPAALVLSILGRKLRRAGARGQEVIAEIYHRFSESLQGMVLIKAYNYEAGALARFRAENARLFDQMMRYLRASALSSPLMEFMGGLILAALIYFGGREIVAGHMTPGQFLAFIASFFAAYDPVKNLAALNPTFQMTMASADRLFQILDEEPAVTEAKDPKPFAAPRQAVLLRGVSFRYPAREAWALRDVHLSVAPGETVALVGPSGAGKSTLALLLLRFFDPAEGAVLVDGTDLRDFSTASLRGAIGLVTQETTLFSGSVLENVALGRAASEEAVWGALRAAEAEEFVRALPQGLQTPLGDRGMRLSGGQRQRLAIARAVLRDPPILILDEATSNLDSAAEAGVQKALETLSQGRTVLIVAHRLSTVRRADRIIVMEGGTVCESGSHAELVSRGGLYSSLHALQELAPA